RGRKSIRLYSTDSLKRCSKVAQTAGKVRADFLEKSFSETLYFKRLDSEWTKSKIFFRSSVRQPRHLLYIHISIFCMTPIYLEIAGIRKDFRFFFAQSLNLI